MNITVHRTALGRVPAGAHESGEIQESIKWLIY